MVQIILESQVQDGVQPASSRVQEEFSRAFPIANVHRLMKKALPRHAKITDESKEIMVKYAAEFISFVTAEANHYCKLDCRTTITAEDLLATMQKLGFDDYAQYSFRYIQLFRHGARVGQYAPPPPPPPPPPQDFQAHNFPLDPNSVLTDPTEMGAILGDDDDEDRELGGGGGDGNSSDGSFDVMAFLNNDD
ncbi:putative transcription factor Hap3/NF-YB family [Medicago truncatula]|uniref:Putative transcription factor Hap3/NF-YB family n=1 Tax=Medicago truncatula TaxID=3880 RepID=A0A396I316_MEDTR|nr:putative transcription factor Hap3/NF-YB family [Medicago truncatula]